jgi:hypothetical protein
VHVDDDALSFLVRVADFVDALNPFGGRRLQKGAGGPSSALTSLARVAMIILSLGSYSTTGTESPDAAAPAGGSRNVMCGQHTLS